MPNTPQVPISSRSSRMLPIPVSSWLANVELVCLISVIIRLELYWTSELLGQYGFEGTTCLFDQLGFTFTRMEPGRFSFCALSNFSNAIDYSKRWNPLHGLQSLSNVRSRNSNQELGHWHWCIDTDHQTSAKLTPDQAVQIKTMRCFQQPDDTLGSTYKSCLYASNKRNPDLWNLLSLMELNANKSAPNEVRSISKSRCAMWWNYVRNCSNISTTTLSVECVIGWRFRHLG